MKIMSNPASRWLARISVCVLVLHAISACSGDAPRIPRPRAYPKITYPERHYIEFSEAQCPLTFRHPDYMQVVRKTKFFGEQSSHPCWFDLEAKALGATLHCSYSPVTSRQEFDKLVTDAFKIADQINQRANYMEEIRVANAYGVHGVLMEFQGAAASPLNFFLTDSVHHFLRMSLYYQARVVQDSLDPVTEFLRTDIAEIVNTLRFE